MIVTAQSRCSRRVQRRLKEEYFRAYRVQRSPMTAVLIGFPWSSYKLAAHSVSSGSLLVVSHELARGAGDTYRNTGFARGPYAAASRILFVSYSTSHRTRRMAVLSGLQPRRRQRRLGPAGRGLLVRFSQCYRKQRVAVRPCGPRILHYFKGRGVCERPLGASRLKAA